MAKELSEKEILRLAEKELKKSDPYLLLRGNDIEARYIREKYKKIYNLDLDKKRENER